MVDGDRMLYFCRNLYILCPNIQLIITWYKSSCVETILNPHTGFLTGFVTIYLELPKLTALHGIEPALLFVMRVQSIVSEDVNPIDIYLNILPLTHWISN